jgi:rubrerythrin
MVSEAAGSLPDEVAHKLTELIHLDIDAVHAYGEAIKRIDDHHVDIRTQLIAFQDDHERHIRELSDLLRESGRPVPERKRDLKGYVIEGMTALRSALGTEQALKAMRQNEVLTNRRYEDALRAVGGHPAAVTIVARNREDERIHLDYIERAIRGRLWEPLDQRA